MKDISKLDFLLQVVLYAIFIVQELKNASIL
jgi:hypothetical protein